MLKLLKTKLKMRLIFWIVFDVTVAMLVVGIVNIKTSYDSSTSLAGRNFLNMAREISVFVDSKISSAKTSLSLIAQMKDIANPQTDLDARLSALDHASQSLDMKGVTLYITDSKGVLLNSAQSGADLSSTVHVKDALGGKEHVGVPSIINSNGDMAMIISRPITHQNETVGAIFMQLPVDFINEAVTQVDTGHDGFACIFDNQGNMIAHKDITSIVQSGSASYIELAKNDSSYSGMAEAMSTMIAESSGIIQYKTNTNQKTLGGFYTTQGGFIVLVRDSLSDINQDARSAIIGSIISAFVCILLIVSIAPRIMGKITRPINYMSRILNQVGMEGDLTLSDEDNNELKLYTAKIDEIGTCAKALEGHFNHLQQVEDTLERLSEGDLTLDIQLLSDKDNISLAMQKTLDSLNRMFREINQSSSIVATASRQISDGSNVLAQGASEQSAATEELSAALTQISSSTGESTELTEKAMTLSKFIRENAQKGTEQMDQMMQAVKEINEAGQNIGKVIKVIDDIAFQTNILALNAAVEAARAGVHGKGFAVVAEEVRNLASKSAEAARDTGVLISNSVAKAELGVKIAQDTAQSLSSIVSEINDSDELISNIAKTTSEQSNTIRQLNISSDSISQIAQENSAAAEESASTAEQMKVQAAVLEGCVRRFKIKG